jgi:lipid II:glycine glycyltransferase (peptidoglycan interpeptide bridge formation enzyme)
MNQGNEFLQSESWLKLQESTGKKTTRFAGDGFSAHGILCDLPVVGKYLYVPRGPLCSAEILRDEAQLKEKMQALIAIASQEKAGWIRIEPATEELLAGIKKVTDRKLVKAPHDTQPREVLVADLSQSEEALLAAMKSKTRYNIRLAEKRGVKVFATREIQHQQAFLDLMQMTADRKEIVPHPRAYYEKFLTVLPHEMCYLFVAEYEGRVLGANLLMIFGGVATYLHGGSSDKHRDVMAPYLLQWEQMKFAKAAGATRYDFGGVRTTANEEQNAWAGITRFKTGFSPETVPVLFPGAYDIILRPEAYRLYDALRQLKGGLNRMKKFIRR